jgi:hydroxymethylpyrimidine pyrophosphatase-like HAD family hydrolase
MKIAVDLDATLTEGSHSIVNYIEMKPNKEAIKKINKLANEGNHITIYTSRPLIERHHIYSWLYHHRVIVNEVVCGKLKADLYIDNNSKRIDDL